MNRLVHILYRIDSRKCTKRGLKFIYNDQSPDRRTPERYNGRSPGWRNEIDRPETACVHVASRGGATATRLSVGGQTQ